VHELIERNRNPLHAGERLKEAGVQVLDELAGRMLPDARLAVLALPRVLGGDPAELPLLLGDEPIALRPRGEPHAQPSSGTTPSSNALNASMNSRAVRDRSSAWVVALSS
jgi:hypothetical protein